ncbi:ribosome-inactivating family protein [Streptomyces roseolus]|uniref:ribosome-inactivating family protein n=1 Tax=Streptomyces roseolus TaxID=67358 RepID=UPI0036F7AE5B
MRRTGRQLAVLLLALAATCGLVNGFAAPKAHADTTRRWSVIDYNISNYQGHFTAGQTPETTANATRYRLMVEQLRSLGGHQMPGGDEPDLLDTPTQRTNRVIQMRIWENFRSDVALYFSADNLYLLGYSVDGNHWQFSDTHDIVNLAEEYRVAAGLAVAPLFQSLQYTGNYATSLDRTQSRGNYRYTSNNLRTWIMNLRNTHDNNRNDRRMDLALVIGATSEAARFGWIQRRIEAVIRHGYDPSDSSNPSHLGPFGVALENRWSQLSALAHQGTEGRAETPVQVDNRTYSDWRQILWGTNNNNARGPAIAPFLALHGSR